MKTASLFRSVLTFVVLVAAGCSTTPVFHQRDAGADGSEAGADSDGQGGNKPTVGGGGHANGGHAGSAGNASGIGGNATGNAGNAGNIGEAGDSAGCGSASDAKNCGSCGHDCTTLTNVAPGAKVECRSGTCYVPPAACLPGFGHCSSLPDDGCEANLSDPDNCGACSQKCSGAEGLCSTATGGSQCSATCTGAATSVCAASCVDLKSDPRNCGTCGHDCTALANVSPNAPGIQCQSSVCYIPPAACQSGFGHCSTRADDGCESELKTPTNCGACGKGCAAPTALCSTTATSVSCSSSCAAPSPDLCGAKCVDMKSDPSNCGACGHDCTALPNVKAGATGVECRAGACYVPPTACSSGHAHCSTQPDDGCEADLSNPSNCGTCSLQCSGTTPLCSTQTQPAKCLPNCSGSSPNVCGTACVNVATDAKNCGSCGHSCSALPNVKSGAIAPAVQCVAGACVLQPAACTSGFGHCSADSNSGCETDLTQPKTCGSCSNACTTPTGLCSTTNGAVCSSSCVSPNPDLCTSKCVNKSNDPSNCGSCGHDCTGLAKLKSGAAVSCSSGGCVVPSGAAACQAGYGNCSSGATDTDGCETNLNTSTANCGTCGYNCASLPNLKSGASVSCSAGGCSIPIGAAQCASGFGNCGPSSNDKDGCETNLNTSAANCGACANNCASLPNLKSGASVSCSAGGCSIPSGAAQCASGFGNCGPSGNDKDGCETNLNTSATNCGSCGNVCASGMACSSGTCKCSTSGQTACSGKCVTLTSDQNNCGSCGNVCGSGMTCSSGTCKCTGSGQTACSGKCVNLTSDQNNCGGCGLSCSVACTSGECIVALATVYGNPVIVNEKTDSVYYVGASANGAQQIRKVARGGGSPQILYTGTGDASENFYGMAVDGSSVYWTMGFGGPVYKVSVTGGDKKFIATTNAALALAVDGSSLYWTEYETGEIRKAPVAGTSDTTFVGTLLGTVADGGHPNQMAIDAQNVYWFGYSGAQRVSINGGSVVTLGPSNYDSSQDEDVYDSIAVDGTYAYWASGESGQVWRARKSDGGAALALASNQAQPFGVAVDASNVYWTGTDGTVNKTPIGGGAPVTLIATDKTFGAGRIAVDSTSVYWSGDGSIMKATPK